MTHIPQPTPFITPWDMAAVYAAAFGLFAPGRLMAARRHAAQTAQPSKG